VQYLTVTVRAGDPVSQLGTELLLGKDETVVLVEAAHDDLDVAVVTADHGDLGRLPEAAHLSSLGVRIVLLVGWLSAPEAMSLLDVPVYGVVRRTDATARRLSTAVWGAAIRPGYLPRRKLGPALAAATMP
jgi:hypothetical protein